MHGGVFIGEEAADTAETILDDPPAVVITPDREAGRFGYRGRAAWATVSGRTTHGYFFRKEWRSLRSKLREKLLDGGGGGQDQAYAQQKRRYRQRRL
ncbi:hypothetical protein [Shinella sp.]|uniref:hypothetical protein n=1 Tax=Shinella sp. TaxID=1870904 RepID=UPI0028AB13B4|nr:hypothetical protein [Shinella sp.]